MLQQVISNHILSITLSKGAQKMVGFKPSVSGSSFLLGVEGLRGGGA